MARADRLARELVVGVAEAVLRVAHARGEPAEHLDIRQRLAHRRDGGVVGEHVEVAVGLVDVGVLELGGGRQHDVGVVHGVGGERIHYHAEKVLARKSFQHLVRIRAHRHRIVVVDDHGMHRRLGGGERVANLRMVDDAGPLRRHQVRALEFRVVEVVVVRGGEQDPARRIAPRAGERRQAGDGARRHAAARVALHAVVEPDRRGFGRAVLARELHHLLDRNAAGFCRPFRRIIFYFLF